MYRFATAAVALLLVSACATEPPAPAQQAPAQAEPTATAPAINPSNAAGPTPTDETSVATEPAPSSLLIATQPEFAPTLTAGWAIVENATAPAEGVVVARGDEKIWLPGFATLPIGDPGDGSEHYQPAMTEAEAQEAAKRFVLNTAPFPANQCALIPEGNDDIEFFVTEAERYVNCLIDSWRPLAASIGQRLPRATVISCALAKDDPQCTNPNYGAMYDINESIYFTEFFGNMGVSSEFSSYTAAHETAHCLQFELSSVENLSILTPLTTNADPDDANRQSRRLETQAQCLAVGMMQSSAPRTREGWIELAGGQSAETHWGAESMEFWIDEALRGRIGNCNTAIADASLLVYP